MMIGRVALKLAALVLAATAAWMPVAQSEEGNEAALMHQLEDVLQQLHEVQRMKAELSAVQAPSSAPAPAIAAPPAGQPAAPRTGACESRVIPVAGRYPRCTAVARGPQGTVAQREGRAEP
jgi:hypothetical protein